MNLGIAFQLADDLLDFTSDEKVLGKAAGADLLEGKLTLPLILLARDHPQIKDELKEILTDGVYQNGSRASIKKKLESNGTVESIRGVARSFAEKARKNLEVLPKTEYCFALDEIPSFVIERNN